MKRLGRNGRFYKFEVNEYETFDSEVRIFPYCKPLKAREEILYRLSHQIVDYLLEKGVPALADSEHHLTLGYITTQSSKDLWELISQIKGGWGEKS